MVANEVLNHFMHHMWYGEMLDGLFGGRCLPQHDVWMQVQRQKLVLCMTSSSPDGVAQCLCKWD